MNYLLGTFLSIIAIVVHATNKPVSLNELLFWMLIVGSCICSLLGDK